ncbi:MAG: signal recognition particle-docking protein FtsY [Synechococcus sp.]|nr:signal recognition particle-docking protein FtsY [Synechococcus sp.]
MAEEFDWFQRQDGASPKASDGASSQDDALDWARQAFARLKAQQEADKAEPAVAPTEQPEVQPESPAAEAPAPAPPAAPLASPVAAPEPQAQVEPEPAAPSDPEPEPVPESQPEPVAVPAPLSWLEQAAARQQESQAAEPEPQPVVPQPPVPEPLAEPVAPESSDAEPQLGQLDDDFIWSAEVLAAQGRSAEQVSIEEIDWLTRLRRGMEKTRQNFVTTLLENLGSDPLSEESLEEIETLLLKADVGVEATDQVLDRLRRRMNETVLEGSEAMQLLKEQLRDLLDAPLKQQQAEPLLAPKKGTLNIWLMVGVNGVGKTTTLGKLANLAVRSGYSTLVAAGDTFRAAAVQQLQVWAERSDVPLVANPSANADPAAVVFDAIGAARAKGTELLLVDTAGRLQTKHNLMEELAKVRRVVDRLAPEAVVESLLVLDASQGQNGLRQAMAFASAAGLTGVVLTKLDGTARGGVALAVASESKLPIRFIGAGEGVRDLRPFNSFEFVEALLARA